MYPMVDIRRIVVVFVIAVLFTILVFTSIDAIYPRPDYNTYCRTDNSPKFSPTVVSINCSSLEIPKSFDSNCSENKGYVSYHYDSKGCAYDYYCETCSNLYDQASQQHNLRSFIISAIAGLIAVAVALYLPMENELNEWIATGFMMGGLFTLIFGTAVYFTDLGRTIRPIIIFFELAIIIFLTYKKLGGKHVKKQK